MVITVKRDCAPGGGAAQQAGMLRPVLSPRMERMLRWVYDHGWLVDVIGLHLAAGPWSVETEKALARRGLLARTEDRTEVCLTVRGWLWLKGRPERC